MSGENAPADSPAGIVGGVLSHLFTGTATDAVIAVLLLVAGVLGFAVWILAKRLNEKDKLLTETVEKSNSELRNLAEKYIDSMNEYHQQQVEQTRAVNDSITGTRILLTEIKGLLTVLTSTRNDSR